MINLERPSSRIAQSSEPLAMPLKHCRATRSARRRRLIGMWTIVLADSRCTREEKSGGMRTGVGTGPRPSSTVAESPLLAVAASGVWGACEAGWLREAVDVAMMSPTTGSLAGVVPLQRLHVLLPALRKPPQEAPVHVRRSTATKVSRMRSSTTDPACIEVMCLTKPCGLLNARPSHHGHHRWPLRNGVHPDVSGVSTAVACVYGATRLLLATSRARLKLGRGAPGTAAAAAAAAPASCALRCIA